MLSQCFARLQHAQRSGEKETGLLEATNRELVEIARKDEPSVLRNRPIVACVNTTGWMK